MPREALFEFADEFAAYLPEHGVAKAGTNYVTWMNRAAKRLERSIGRADLSSQQDVERLIGELLALAKQNPEFKFAKGSKEESDQRSTFRIYAEMVEATIVSYFGRLQTFPFLRQGSGRHTKGFSGFTRRSAVGRLRVSPTVVHLLSSGRDTSTQFLGVLVLS